MHFPKEYGDHKYNHNGGTVECEHGCGCWMSSTDSGGPTGLDPFGSCPKNPKDGALLGGTADYDSVVNERIRDLTYRLLDAEKRLERVSPSKTKLGMELAEAKRKLAACEELLADIRRLVGTGAPYTI